MDTRLFDLRREYATRSLSENDVLSDPLAQFRIWFDEALAVQVKDANAMSLATVDAHGRPTARIVLLKGFDENGFVFYSNYLSRKGVELKANPHACLLFYWAELERQVRIEGDVELGNDADSDVYFASRPRASQLGALASQQSCVLKSRQELEEKMAALSAQYQEKEIPRPPQWGGLRLKPRLLEFWQGRPSRLHDRIVYERESLAPEALWTQKRLAP
jgi:pyridoxamine 5'-phosphate oxidase